MPSMIDAGLLGFRKGHGLRLAIAREFAGDQELDPDAIFRVSELLAAGERRNIAEAVQVCVDRS